MESINSHATIRNDNYEQCCAETAKYGPLRVQLSVLVSDILSRLKVQHGLDAGSLIGAFRNGKMLPHDDDFDMWFYSDSLTDLDDPLDKAMLLQLLMHRIKPLLPKKTKVRIVTSYCFKLEIYWPEYGKYDFLDTNYHNVTVDVTMILPIAKDSFILQYQHTGLRHRQHTLPNLLPTGLIEYEGQIYPAPASVQNYLIEMYDYVGPNAYFDHDEKIYKPKNK